MKHTKKALLLSVMSLLLCVSMLVGTTFAWFTDSVSTGKNVIAAGNLDIELQYSKDFQTWTTVDENTNMFDTTLWEPGHTEVVYLHITNEGSLYLKYQLGINIVSETTGINVDGKAFKLSDHIVYGVKEVTGKFADRAEARKDLESQKLNVLYSSDVTTLTPKDDTVTTDEKIVALVVYMPEEVDNVANHKTGTTVPQIKLGIELNATQKDAEIDSFGPDYDKNAGLPWDGETVTAPVADANGVIHITNAAELVAMMDITSKSLYTGKTIVLDADIDLNGHTVKGIGSDTSGFSSTFDGQGHTISNFKIDASDRSNYAGLFNQVSHGGTIKNLTVENATIIGKGMVGAIASSVDGGSTIDNCKAIDCTLIGVKKVGAVVGYTSGSTVTNNYAENCTVYFSEKEGGEVIGYVNDGSSVSDNTPENVTVKQATVILTAEDLLALSGTKINGTYVLMCDIDMSGKDMKPIQLTNGSANKLTFEGNGHTISNLNLVEATQNGMPVSALFNIMHSGAELNISDLTLENVTSTSGKYAAAVVAYNSTSLTMNLNNVDVAGAKVKAETVGTFVGYTTGNVNLTDCDVSGITLDGAFDEDKVGAYIGTANTTGCAVTTTNCTNNSEYREFGRVINGATWNGGVPVTSTSGLISAIKSAPVGQETEIILATGTYAGNIDITLAAMGAQAGNVVIKAAEGATPVITGTVTLGLYENKTFNVAHWDAVVTFEGITFDHAEAEKHSLEVQSLNAIHLKDCTIIGDGEYGIGSAGGNDTGASSIIGCDFVNAGMQILGNFGGVSAAEPLVIKNCTFDESVINVQAGHAVTVEGCTFENTLTDAHNDESFYVIRTQAIPMTISGCEFNVDSTVTGMGVAGPKGWGVFVNRSNADWTVSNVEINMTAAAQAQTALVVAKCLSTGKINMTNWKLNGVAQ